MFRPPNLLTWNSVIVIYNSFSTTTPLLYSPDSLAVKHIWCSDFDIRVRVVFICINQLLITSGRATGLSSACPIRVRSCVVLHTSPIVGGDYSDSHRVCSFQGSFDHIDHLDNSQQSFQAQLVRLLRLANLPEDTRLEETRGHIEPGNIRATL